MPIISSWTADRKLGPRAWFLLEKVDLQPRGSTSFYPNLFSLFQVAAGGFYEGPDLRKAQDSEDYEELPF